MRKFLGKLGATLYKRYGDGDINDLIRESMGILTNPLTEEELNNMDQEERTEFLAKCYEYSQEDVLMRLIDGNIYAQRDYSWLNAEKGDHFAHGKLSAHGVGLLKQQIEKWAKLYLATLEKKDEKFDKFKVMAEDKVEQTQSLSREEALSII